MEIDETHVQIRVHSFHITRQIIIEEKQLTKTNLGSEVFLQLKISVDLEPIINNQLIELLKEFKDIFSWTYKDLKGIPLDVV